MVIDSEKAEIIIICGATAAGKSGVAVETARNIGGEIISADSMQIYKGFDIGTAKITESEMKGIPHYLIDIIDGKENFSVSQYVSKALCYTKVVKNHAKTPIIAGGTGLYIDGILYDMSYGECEPDYALRAELEKKYSTDGGERLYNEMLLLDPEDTAKYHKNNKHRLLRAWEIYLTCGKTKSELKADKKPRFKADIVVVDREREELYSRIDLRVEEMFERGIVKEVERLISEGINFDCQAMQAIGYKEFKPYFERTATLDDVKAAIKINTRHYAKRQITWFKRYKDAVWLNPDDAVKYLSDKYGRQSQ